jgi:hypothetical protein
MAAGRLRNSQHQKIPKVIMKKVIAYTLLGMLLQACAWVTLTPEGEKARVLSAGEVTGCKKLGKTTVSVKGDIAGMERLPDRVKAELEILARNSAADLGGDTVVPVGQPEDGRQVFEVYRCVNP